MNCCFTGHRPKSLPWKQNENDIRCIKLKEVLSAVIEQAIIDGYYDFHCGMALGFDIYCAEAVLEKMKTDPRIKLHALIPCISQTEKWSSADKMRYERILEKCSSKTCISPNYTSSCMHSRNFYMVDNSQRVIALWNGNFHSGTASTISYAKKNHTELYIIRPSDLSVSVM